MFRQFNTNMGKVNLISLGSPSPAEVLKGRLEGLGYRVHVQSEMSKSMSLCLLHLDDIPETLPEWVFEETRLVICFPEASFSILKWCAVHKIRWVFFLNESNQRLGDLVEEARFSGRPRARALRVVILHPMPLVLRAFSQELKNQGFESEVISDPEQVWDKLEHHTIDILYLAADLGNLTGFEFLSMVRMRGLLEGLPIDILCDGSNPAEGWSDLGRFGASRVPIDAHPKDFVAYTKGRIQNYRSVVRKARDQEHDWRQLTFEKSALDEHAIVSVTDEAGRIIYVNHKFCEVSRYTAQELVGQPHRIVNSGYHPKAFFEDLWTNILAGKIWHGEICNKRKDGSFYWVKTTIVPIYENGTGLKRFISVRTDITKEKLLEDSLSLSDLRYEQSQRFSNIGTWDWNIKTGELFWSECIAPLFGYQSELPETTYENFLAIVHPQDREAVVHAVNECVAGRAGYGIEHRVLWDDGSVHWLLEQGGVVLDEAGKPDHMLGVVQDVTHRKYLEFQLEDQSRALRALNDAVAEFVLSHDFIKARKILLEAMTRVFKCTFCFIWDLASSRSIFAFTGTKEEPLKLILGELALQDHDSRLYQELEMHMAALKVTGKISLGSKPGASYNVRTSRIVKGREPLCVIGFETSQLPQHTQDLNALPLFEGGARLLYILWQATVSDLTLREKLVHAKEKAESASEAKSRFLSQMSHELRTPLNSVIGFSQLLACGHEGQLNETQSTYVETIEKAGRHLLDIINDILALTHLDSDSVILKIGLVKLRPLVEGCIVLLQPLAEKRGIRIQNLISESQSDKVFADALRLKQILINLMSNGIKYNCENGSLAISLEIRDDHLRLMVEDTGAGISEENQTRLFEEFERLGMDQSGIEGSGIGLNICKRLITEMNGRIGVESVEGKGSCFWLELPSERAAIGTKVTEVSMRAWEPNSAGRILYVEDNAANIQLVQQVVGMYSGLTLDVALTGVEGLKMIDEHPYDLILLDINLPDISGVDLMHNIEALYGKEATIVALTANMVEDLETSECPHGFNDVLTKPVDINKLIAVLQKYL